MVYAKRFIKTERFGLDNRKFNGYRNTSADVALNSSKFSNGYHRISNLTFRI